LYGGQLNAEKCILEVSPSAFSSQYNPILKETHSVPAWVPGSITSFRIGKTAATISGKDITLTVPRGTDVTKLTPTIVHNGKSVSPASGVAKDFTTPVKYTVTAEDGTTNTYTVTVTVQPAPLSTRLSGYGASDTAAAISKEAFPKGSTTVVLARDDDYMDAMSATGLAGSLDAPILTTNRLTLSKSAADEIRRLGASTVYIIGGPVAMPSSLERALLSISGVRTVKRIWGNSPTDTSVACAKEIERLDGSKNTLDTVIVATSVSFIDALSVSSYAYKYHIPILIVAPYSADPKTDRRLTSEAIAIAKGYTHVLVPGGPGALPVSSVEGTLKGKDIRRVYGFTGFDTSDAIAREFVSKGLLDAGTVGIANGDPLPRGVDALAAAALLGKNSAPVILVSTSGTSKGITGYVTAYAGQVTKVYHFGGTAVVPPGLVTTIEAILKKR
jgi:putative cell wall-binding protein